MPNKNLKVSKGFTLVELLIVISIIAILSVIGIVIYSSVQKNARDARRRADLSSIAIMLELYKNQHDTYTPATSWPCTYSWSSPFDNTTWGVDGSATTACGSPSLRIAFNSLFSSGRVPRDPLCTTSPCTAWPDYVLTVPNGGASYILQAKLEIPPLLPISSICSVGYNYCIQNQQ